MSDEESGSSFEGSEYGDSDKELQEAFSKGLLKPGLNEVKEVAKRPPINNVHGLKAKLDSFRKRLAWFERLDVTVDRAESSNEKSADKKEKMISNENVHSIIKLSWPYWKRYRNCIS